MFQYFVPSPLTQLRPPIYTHLQLRIEHLLSTTRGFHSLSEDTDKVTRLVTWHW